MLAALTFCVEVVMIFVLVDFALQSQWGTLAVGVLAMGAAATSLAVRGDASSSSAADKKQGAYGKVQVHQETWASTLLRPAEVWAMVRYKVGSMLGGRSGAVYGLGHGLENVPGLLGEDVAFCSKHLKQVSRSFATVITYLPNTADKPLRLAVAVFYLVLRALDTVEDEMDLRCFDAYVTDEDRETSVVGDDTRLVAKQRLLRLFATRLRDAMDALTSGEQGDEDDEGVAARERVRQHQHLEGFGHGSERALVDRLDVLVRVLCALPPKLAAVILSITDEMGRGMADYVARDLHNGTDDAEDFEAYCHVAAGTVGDGLTRLFAACGYCPPQLTQRRDLWDAMGSLLQRTNIIRDYLEDLVDGRAWWPRSVWEQYVPADPEFGRTPSLSRLADASSIIGGKSTSCLNHMVADALQLVTSALEYLEQFDDASVLSFCALPQVMAVATLAECFDNPKVFQGVVKIRKGAAVLIMMDLDPASYSDVRDLRRNYLVWFAKSIRIIQTKARRAASMDPQAQRTDFVCGQLDKVLQAKLQAITVEPHGPGRKHAA